MLPYVAGLTYTTSPFGLYAIAIKAITEGVHAYKGNALWNKEFKSQSFAVDFLAGSSLFVGGIDIGDGGLLFFSNMINGVANIIKYSLSSEIVINNVWDSSLMNR